jgi:hypothetical protein
MRRIDRNNGRESGLAAAWKVTAVAFAVAVLAIAAKQPVDLDRDVPGASGNYMVPAAARDDVPLVAVDVPQVRDETSRAARMLAVAPASRGASDAVTGIALSPTATVAEPVATF